jgi:hypothetical protein
MSLFRVAFQPGVAVGAGEVCHQAAVTFQVSNGGDNPNEGLLINLR